ncbi:hypothetical protein CHUAL_012968 [Chamberlinius hualienensis]
MAGQMLDDIIKDLIEPYFTNDRNSEEYQHIQVAVNSADGRSNIRTKRGITSTNSNKRQKLEPMPNFSGLKKQNYNSTNCGRHEVMPSSPNTDYYRNVRHPRLPLRQSLSQEFPEITRLLLQRTPLLPRNVYKTNIESVSTSPAATSVQVPQMYPDLKEPQPVNFCSNQLPILELDENWDQFQGNSHQPVFPAPLPSSTANHMVPTIQNPQQSQANEAETKTEDYWLPVFDISEFWDFFQ